MPITDFSKPRVTTRAMVDPTRKCALRCEFCYYLVHDLFYTEQTWEQHKKWIDDAVSRGCDSCDITGGEPMQGSHITELVKYAVEKGIYPRIITSLICPEKTLDSVLDAGVADWLISMHGAKEETHNDIVKIPKARTFQIRRMAKIAQRMRYCCNYVMVEKNQDQMADWARWLVSLDHQPPKTVNFINFNVFGPWLSSPEWIEKGKANVVDLRVTKPILNEAIDILEEAGVGVNIRYYPYCGVEERHYKNICNDLQVAFDFGEWDNSIGGHDLEHGLRYIKQLTNSNEEKGVPCNTCSHQWICGGANKIWHKLSNDKFGYETLHPLPVLAEDVAKDDFWHYRCKNTLGLDPRVQGFRKLETA